MIEKSRIDKKEPYCKKAVLVKKYRIFLSVVNTYRQFFCSIGNFVLESKKILQESAFSVSFRLLQIFSITKILPYSYVRNIGNTQAYCIIDYAYRKERRG